jgi:predicted nucleic acid-binding protein
LILQHIASGEWLGIRSDVLDYEVRQIPDSLRRACVEQLVTGLRQYVSLESKDIARAKELAASGLSPIDALHVACAERSQVDVFLTTDDQLLRCATQPASRVRVRVENPVQWLREVMDL